MVAGHVALYAICRKFQDSKVNSFIRSNLAGLPYYSDSNKVIDLRTAFFHLDEDQDYNPSLFYPGKAINFQPDGVL